MELQGSEPVSLFKSVRSTFYGNFYTGLTALHQKQVAKEGLLSSVITEGVANGFCPEISQLWKNPCFWSAFK